MSDPAPTRVSPWRAPWLHRATRTDRAYLACAALLALLAIGSGHAAARHVSPAGARSVSALLDELELPRLLPDATLADRDGGATTLFALTPAPRTILTFYAPWCAPCQEELPILVEGAKHAPERLVVVVGVDEDEEEVVRQLANLGLQDLPYRVDATRALHEEGRVTALPTTFLLGRNGRVEDRIVGYSGYRLYSFLYLIEEDADPEEFGDAD